MENVGKKPLDEPVDKKRWVILFSAFGVVIVGLIIAIIVVAANRGGSKPVNEDVSKDEIYRDYLKDIDEINDIVADEEYNPERVLSLYTEKIDATKDRTLKLLLKKDYYYMLSVYYEDGVREEVLKNLIEIDNELQAVDTALMIANRAGYYGNEELRSKYNEIADERMGISEEEVEALRAKIENTAAEGNKSNE